MAKIVGGIGCHGRLQGQWPSKDSGRATYVSATDAEALEGFHALTRTEGIIPALESSHALAYAARLAPTMSPDQIIVVNLSGRGDKDIHTVAAHEGIKI